MLHLLQILAGEGDMFQTFADRESVKDKPADMQAVRQVLNENQPAQDTSSES
jgi:hypothetical protein